MAYRLIKEFVKLLNGHGTSTFSGPLSPLLLQIPWSRDPKNPIILFGINRGRESLEVVDEYEYQLCGENKFRKYFKSKVTKKELENDYNVCANNTQALYDEFVERNFSKDSEEDVIKFLKRGISLFEAVADTVYIETLDFDMAISLLVFCILPIL